jgi:hypothetical protein
LTVIGTGRLRKDPLITSTEFSHPLVEEAVSETFPAPREGRYGSLFLQPAYEEGTEPTADDWQPEPRWQPEARPQRRPSEQNRRRYPRR